jgi:O-antigen/teichoic acid export membrane protein
MSREPHWLTGSIWNLLGTGIPFGFAIICMPLLLHKLGPDRYGLLLLAWGVVGYFSLFDFGLGRAITQLVARAYSVSHAEAAPVIATGLLALGIFGMVGGLLLYSAAPYIAQVDRIPAALREETIQSVKVLGAGLPFVIVSAGLRGALEGVFDFAWINIIRIVLGIGTYLVPVLVMVLAVRLDWICAALVLLRVVGCLAYYIRCRFFFSLEGSRKLVSVTVAKRLMGYGGWITISNLMSPFMAYLDRFLVAGAISVALAGYYATSQEIVTKLQIIPSAILAVLFPAISRSHASSPERAGDIFFRGTQYVTFVLLPLAATIVLFAREGLELWFGHEFATQSYRVAQIMTVGSFINCLAFNPFFFLQGIGRPDITAKIHVIELPVYLLMLWLLMTRWGVIGVALAWSFRMVLDLTILTFATSRQSAVMREIIGRAVPRFIWPIAALASLLLIQSVAVKSLALLAIAALSTWAIWTEWQSGHIVLVDAKNQ